MIVNLEPDVKSIPRFKNPFPCAKFTTPKIKPAIKIEILPSTKALEILTKSILLNNPKYFFSGYECLSKSYAFTGKYSLKIGQNNCKEGFRTKLTDFKPQDVYVVKVKVKRPSWIRGGMLIIESDNKQISINETFERPIANSSWAEIGTYFEIPKDFKGKEISIYCRNSDTFDAFFDDLIIKKVKK